MIEKAELIRLEKSAEGTFGVLRLNGQVFCVTLEPPDYNNSKNISCIPAGRYSCRRVQSPRFGATFEVREVPGRSHILLHPGNVTDDTQGCVLLGRQFGFLRGDRAVLNSGRTFAQFMEQCKEAEGFPFIIEEMCGDSSEEGPWTTSV
ncbi:DUF5675 family protein [Pseudodesulfovibrio sp.]|nr:DUF5675 family protein [Pseudodesulfovibrio sp.]